MHGETVKLIEPINRLWHVAFGFQNIRRVSGVPRIPFLRTRFNFTEFE